MPLENEPSVQIASVVSYNTGDTTSINLNWEWRKIVSGLLAALTVASSWERSEIDAAELVQIALELLSDIYD